MTKYNDYILKDMSYSVFNIKKLEIYGHFEYEINDVIRKTRNAINEFLNQNKEVDYLIAYYFPTPEDKKNNVALCYLILDKDTKNIILSDKELYNNLIWNEDYIFFSDIVKDKISSDYRFVNQASSIQEILWNAYFILYDLEMTIKYQNFSKINNFYERLENWVITAEHIYSDYEELNIIIKNDFSELKRHMSNILYCCISKPSEHIMNQKDRRWIFHNELEEAKEKFEVLYKQLGLIMNKNLFEKNFAESSSLINDENEK